MEQRDESAVRCFALLVLFLPSALVHAGLKITDPPSGSVTRLNGHLLRGTTLSAEPIRCEIRGSSFVFEPKNGLFAIPIEFKGGTNTVVLHQGTESATVEIIYRPSSSPMRVSFVQVEPKPQSTTAQPTPGLKLNEQIDAAAKLWQLGLADRMPNRQSFQLQLNPEGTVKTHLLNLGLTRDELGSMSLGQLTALLYPLIEARNPGKTTKTVAILPLATLGASGPIALGGGSIVLVAGEALRNWPKRARDFQAKNGETAKELGATFLELLKTFGAQDTNEPNSLLSAPEKFAVLFATDTVEPKMPEFVAAQLEFCPWLMPDLSGPAYSSSPDYKLINNSKTLQVHSDLGLGFVGWYQGSNRIENAGRVPLANPGVKFVDISAASLRSREGQPPVRLVAIDLAGNRTDRVVSDLVQPRVFLRQWQITTRPISWSEAPFPRKLDEIGLADLVERLMDKPSLELDSETVVSFGLEFHQAGSRLAYALSRYDATEGGVKVLCIRPDDNARVWVNRKLVLDKIGVTAASSNRVQVQLLPGANEILVESEPDLSGRAFSIWLDDAS